MLASEDIDKKHNLENRVVNFIKSNYKVDFEYSEDSDPFINDLGIDDPYEFSFLVASEFNFDSCIDGDEITINDSVSHVIDLVMLWNNSN